MIGQSSTFTYRSNGNVGRTDHLYDIALACLNMIPHATDDKDNMIP